MAPAVKIFEQKREISLLYSTDDPADETFISAFFYPYDRDIAAENYKFLPYEEYVDEVTAGGNTLFEPVTDPFRLLFGISVAASIGIVVAIIDVNSILSVEALVSMFGAYTVGKEIWPDVNGFLIGLSRRWRVSWRAQQFSLIREDYGTIQQFYTLARKKRYERIVATPSRLEFNEHSNSKIVDLLYSFRDIKAAKHQPVKILSIFSGDRALVKLGYMLGVKIAESRKLLFINFNTEYFQARDNGKLGIVDRHGGWREKQAIVRKTISVGRFKVYLRSKVTKLSLINS